MGQIFAFITATAVSLEDDENSRRERNGWIDREDMTELEESRNYVRPLISVDESDAETLAEEIRDVLGDGSLYEDNGDGTYYGITENVHDGWSFTYAVHFKRKYLGSAGYVEVAWHPENDGGISLSE